MTLATIQSALNSLRQDRHYPVASGHFASSWDFCDINLQTIGEELHFLRSLNATNRDLYELTARSLGMAYQSTPMLGAFYDLMATGLYLPQGPFELHPLSRLFRRILADHGYDNYRVTGQPRTLIGTQGIPEGVIINAMAQEFRKEAKSPKYRQTQEAWHKAAHAHLTKVTRMLQKSAQADPAAVVIRLDLTSTKPVRRQDRAEANSNIARLMDALQSRGVLPLLGLAWNRDYLPELGYRHHVVVVISTSHISNQQAIDVLAALWFEATDGAGLSTCLWDPNIVGHRCLGSGDYVCNQALSNSPLLASLKLFRDRDLLLRLRTEKGIPDAGIFQPSMIRKPTH